MTNTEEKQARSKQIPQVEQLNTTATEEKLEVLSNNAYIHFCKNFKQI